MGTKHNFLFVRFAFYLLPSLASLVFWLLPAFAQTGIQLLPSNAPLDLELLKPDANLAGRNVITADTPSQKGLTVPSLWWADEQFGGKLLTHWLAYPDERRVDLVVNRQLWSFLDYVGRYSFVNKLGTVASDYGYNTRVFNELGAPLAAYTCDFDSEQPFCQLKLESSTQDSFRVRSTPGQGD